MKKILLLGPLPNDKFPSSFGGATILMKSLVNFFLKKNMNYNLIVTNTYFGTFSKVKAPVEETIIFYFHLYTFCVKYFVKRLFFVCLGVILKRFMKVSIVN